MVVAQRQLFGDVLLPLAVGVRDDNITNILALELRVGRDFDPWRQVVPQEVDALVELGAPLVEHGQFHLLECVLHAVELEYLFGHELVEHHPALFIQVAA